MSLFLKKLWRYLRRAYWSGHFPSLNALLRNRGRLLAYYGFLGDGNFGDELVYEAARSLLRPCLLVPDTLRKPVVTGLLLKAGFLAFRGEVLGGGTLVGAHVKLPQAGRSKAKTAKSVFVHGTGTGTFISDGWIDALRSRAAFGGMRGRASQARLASKGCEVDIDGDAAFYFFGGDDRTRQDIGSVLVNCGTHNVESTMTAARSEIRRFVAAMLDRGVAVEFLPFHSVDVELGLELKREFPVVRLHGIPRDFAAATAIFEHVGFAVGERLHFAVMSLLCGCPCFSVMYEPKHHELLDSLDCLWLGAPPDEVACSTLMERYARRSEFDWLAIRAKMTAYKHKQEADARAFLAHLGVVS